MDVNALTREIIGAAKRVYVAHLRHGIRRIVNNFRS